MNRVSGQSKGNECLIHLVLRSMAVGRRFFIDEANVTFMQLKSLGTTLLSVLQLSEVVEQMLGTNNFVCYYEQIMNADKIL